MKLMDFKASLNLKTEEEAMLQKKFPAGCGDRKYGVWLFVVNTRIAPLGREMALPLHNIDMGKTVLRRTTTKHRKIIILKL